MSVGLALSIIQPMSNNINQKWKYWLPLWVHMLLPMLQSFLKIEHQRRVNDFGSYIVDISTAAQ